MIRDEHWIAAFGPKRVDGSDDSSGDSDDSSSDSEGGNDNVIEDHH